MIVICTYYLDGSTRPVLQFIPAGPGQNVLVAATMAQELNNSGKDILVYHIEAIDKPVTLIYPAQMPGQ